MPVGDSDAYQLLSQAGVNNIYTAAGIGGETHVLRNETVNPATWNSPGGFVENAVNVASIIIPAGQTRSIYSDNTRWVVLPTAAVPFDHFTPVADGTTDQSEDIARTGRVGIGAGQTTATIESTLDVNGSIAGGVSFPALNPTAPGTLIPDALYVQVNPPVSTTTHLQIPAGTPDGRVIFVQNYGLGTLVVNSNGAGSIYPIDGTTPAATQVTIPALSQAMFIHNAGGWVGPAFQHASPSSASKSFRATGTTDASGNVTFNMTPAAFAAAPVVALSYQGAGGINPVDYRITALSATSVTAQFRISIGINIALLGLTLLGQSTPLAGATVHLLAFPAGSTA